MASSLIENDIGDSSQVARCSTRWTPGSAASRQMAPMTGHRPTTLSPHGGQHPSHHSAPCSRGTEHHRQASSVTEGPAHCRDGGARTDRQAGGNGRQPTLTCRDGDGPLQDHHWSWPARTQPDRPARRGGRWSGGSQSHVALRPAELRPPSANGFLRPLGKGNFKANRHPCNNDVRKLEQRWERVP